MTETTPTAPVSDEIAISGIKNGFLISTGKYVKISPCNRWESEANFTFKATIGQIIKMVFDFTEWTWEGTYSSITGTQGNKIRGDRNQEKIYRRGMIDFIAVNNGCTLVSCAKFTERKDHTNVLNSVKKFEERLETEGYTSRMFMEVINFCKENYHLYKDKDYTKEEIIAGEEDT